MNADQVGLLNCSVCDIELVGPKTFRNLIGTPRAEWPATCRELGHVAGRILDRPICHKCATTKPKKGRSAPVRDDSPGLDDGAGAMEGD